MLQVYGDAQGVAHVRDLHVVQQRDHPLGVVGKIDMAVGIGEHIGKWEMGSWESG
jgi:hypothetical protein